MALRPPLGQGGGTPAGAPLRRRGRVQVVALTTNVQAMPGNTGPTPPAPAVSQADIEAGRKLFAAPWQFVAAAGALSVVPAMAGVEIAFAGRSNVGKSSLINALVGRRMLARTSNTPGRTQELIFFAGKGQLMLVDLPGYGYAAAPKAKIVSWTALAHAYLSSRSALARVYVLIDARHGLKPVDARLLDALDRAAVSYQLVLTKADQVQAGDYEAIIARLHEGCARRPAAYPDIALTSARTGHGIAELRGAIAQVIAQRRGARPPDRE
jgi:GTP-binding protein